MISTSLSQLSVADTTLAPVADGTSSHSTVMSVGTPANTGAVLSPTSIRCDAVVSFPQLSVAIHVLTIVKAFSHPVLFSCVSSNVISTSLSQLSVAVTVSAPEVVGISSHSTVRSEGTPDKTGAVLSPTSIVCDAVVSFPQLSVAVHVLTNVKAFSHPALSCCVSSNIISTSLSQLSFAVTASAPEVVGISSHSTVRSAGTPDKTGAVLSPTSIR